MVVCVTVIKLTILWQISTVKGLWIKYGWSENKFVWQSRRSKNGGIKYWEWMTRKWGVEGKVRLHLLLSPRVLEQSLKLVQRAHEKEEGEDARRGSKSTHNTRYHTRWLCSRNMTRFWMTPRMLVPTLERGIQDMEYFECVEHARVCVKCMCGCMCCVSKMCLLTHLHKDEKIFDHIWKNLWWWFFSSLTKIFSFPNSFFFLCVFICSWIKMAKAEGGY
jgi:hypothetical protein